MGGVKAETRWVRGKPIYTLLGVGINVNNRIPSMLPNATSLSIEGGKAVDLECLLRRSVDRLDHYLRKTQSDASSILDSWRSLSETLGKRVLVHDYSGKTFCGIAADVGEEGALILDIYGKKRKIFDGSLEHEG